MIPLGIEIQRLDNRRCEGQILGDAVRGLPADLRFTLEMPPFSMDETGKGAVWEFTDQGILLVGQAHYRAVEALGSSIILATVVLDIMRRKDEGLTSATLLIPYPENGEVFHYPVRMALEMNGLAKTV